ncbi:hypothetical protein H6F43_14315 [Leptolyngbya sp. FACHB-36]|uniref:hypothetical protein n=1 Tax=Leptolyngbya sp. FACHB-36 TaxID=2692808 RepID=UPI001680C5C4|nr:hypothetical protein [Leptolyngbya sp. FACHB-36]MBD2021351.1 hypothetical protein [Leptolyngbya sp. FACHB-36]
MQDMIDSSSPIDAPEAVLEQARALQTEIHQTLQQLSIERLKTVSDFASFLLERERSEATEELMQIPGLLEKIQQHTSNEQGINWRTVRSDV